MQVEENTGRRNASMRKTIIGNTGIRVREI